MAGQDLARGYQGIMLEDGEWADVALEFQWLCGLLVVVVVIASLRFEKQLL